MIGAFRSTLDPFDDSLDDLHNKQRWESGTAGKFHVVAVGISGPLDGTPGGVVCRAVTPSSLREEGRCRPRITHWNLEILQQSYSCKNLRLYSCIAARTPCMAARTPTETQVAQFLEGHT